LLSLWSEIQRVILRSSGLLSDDDPLVSAVKEILGLPQDCEVLGWHEPDTEYPFPSVRVRTSWGDVVRMPDHGDPRTPKMLRRYGMKLDKEERAVAPMWKGPQYRKGDRAKCFVR